MQKQFTLLGAGLAIILGSAYVHGVLSDRWGRPADLSVAAGKLENLPHIVGDWHSRPLEIPESQLQGAEAVGHLARVYRNDKTQTEIRVMVLCGAHGPIAVHPPTICFTSAGLEQAHPEKIQTIAAGNVQDKFWKTLFTKRSPDGVRSELDTYWAWSVNGECEAPENPRLTFGGRPHLYKIYVTHLRGFSQGANAKAPADAPCEEFLEVFLPAFRTVLSES